MRKIIYILALVTLMVSCNEYNKVLKSTDYELKYDYAKKYFEEKKYARASVLLEELITIFKGTDKAEESLYLLGRSYYESKDYLASGQYFTTYYNTFPKGQYTELARYYTGYGYFLDSPEPKLDQTETYKAINELQLFLEYFPRTDKKEEVQKMLVVLQDKLAQKELINARLYYDLGTYMGNNYLSAVITAQNALKDYPYTKHKEEFLYLILESKYKEATHSVPQKMADRMREVVDEYYAYANEYPEGKYKKDAKKMLTSAQKYIEE